MALPPVSIIVPTLNEEKYIGSLLASLAAQTNRNFEVVVVDGQSQDKTVWVASQFKKLLPRLSILKAPQSSVSLQRNIGAQKSLFELLLFLDADVILDPTFIDLALGEFQRKKADLATSSSIFINGNSVDYLTSKIMNASIDLTKGFYPLSYGSTIFAKKEFHQKIGGFDQNMKFYEDSDYCQRAAKAGAHFELLKSSFPYTSARRFVHNGRLRTYWTGVAFAIDTLLYGKDEAQKRVSFKPVNSLTKLKREIRQATLSRRFKRLNRNLKAALLELQEELKSL